MLTWCRRQGQCHFDHELKRFTLARLRADVPLSFVEVEGRLVDAGHHSVTKLKKERSGWLGGQPDLEPLILFALTHRLCGAWYHLQNTSMAIYETRWEVGA